MVWIAVAFLVVGFCASGYAMFLTDETQELAPPRVAALGCAGGLCFIIGAVLLLFIS